MIFDDFYKKLMEYRDEKDIFSDEALALILMLWNDLKNSMKQVDDEQRLEELTSNIRVLSKYIITIYEKHSELLTEAQKTSRTVQLTEQIKELEKKLAQHLNQETVLYDRINALQNQINGQETKEKQLKEELEEEKKKLNTISGNEKSLTEALEQCRKDVSDGNNKLPILQQEYDELLKEKEKKAEDEKTLSNHITDVKTQISKYDNSIISKKSELEEEKGKLANQKNELEQVCSEYESVHAEFIAAREEYLLIMSQIKQVRANTEDYKLLGSLEKKG